ncbi:hypothetical protein [Undibacterium squillarum]|uniref:hypothetical protein n=1 Tax=Undibacterium squillarum TaxID=1131567 RepID=UPI0035B4003D
MSTEPAVPQFAHRDPALPAFWEERFAQQFTPWNQSAVPQALLQFLAQQPAGKVLIPACGHGHEIPAFVQAGWQTEASDFSAAAVDIARQQPGVSPAMVVCADFFEYQPAFRPDLIYERAFLCAIPAAMRPQLLARWAELLPAGGLLAGFFLTGNSEAAARRGPPFFITEEDLHALLEPVFTLREQAVPPDSLALFQGGERWMVWQRR